MKTKSKNVNKFYRISGRVVANTGDFCVVELTSGDYSVAHRGYNEFSDMFDTDFRELLPVGLRVQCEQNDSGVRLLHRKSTVPAWKDATR